MSNNNLFKKVAVCTDIHFGNKSNSTTHNQDCEDFIDWFIETAHKNDCETCMFLGDWHHQRASINVHTLNYSLRSLEKLGKSFEKFYFITGNHDLYYRDRRDLNSVEFASRFPGISIVNQTINEGNVAIVPWLVGDDFKKIKKIKAKYIFGHFDLPHFYMNAMVQMPDHGHGLKAEDLKKPEMVFSGHFHKRQERGNVIYPGNCFPHNYSDAWDDNRGLMFLKWGGQPEYVNWPDAPRYRTISLSKLIDNPEKILSNKTYCRITLDVPITYEEANYIKETFAAQYNLREIALMPSKKEEHAQDWTAGAELQVESVDQIVLSQLQSIDSSTIKNKLLIDIYNGLNINA